jgi:DNA-binding MarR family transcriptional regulator
VAELVELGVIDIVPGPDRRQRRVRLSLRGSNLVRLGWRIRRRIEKRLIDVAGLEQYEIARSILSGCLEALDGMERIRSRRILLQQ